MTHLQTLLGGLLKRNKVMVCIDAFKVLANYKIKRKSGMQLFLISIVKGFEF